MSVHIYLENILLNETYNEINTLVGSYFEKTDDNYDRAIITSVILEENIIPNSEIYWCVEIVESSSYPIIKYYHFRNFNDLVAIYQAKKYNFIEKRKDKIKY